MNACKPRSPEAIAEAVALVDPEHNVDLLPHDITGDDIDETFCNVALHQLTTLLGCPIPRVLARDQLAWLRGEGSATHGWRQVFAVGAMEAAARGEPVVVGWVNPEQARDKAGNLRFDAAGNPIWRPSHVALVRAPPPGFSGVWITQAGRSNFNLAPLIKGFGTKAPLLFFAHA